MNISTAQLEKLRRELDNHRSEIRRLEQKQAKLQSRIESVISRKGSKSRRVARAIQNPVHKAVNNSDPGALHAALAAGSDPNAQNRNGETPLLLAVYLPNNIQLVRTLLENGADVNLADKEGNTPLIVGVRDENLATIKELVQHGAEVNAANNAGDTPLTNAATWGSSKVVRFLVDHGAQIDKPDGAGLTPLELARQQGHGEIASFLRKSVR